MGFRVRSQSSPLFTDSAKHWREGAAIRARSDGLWELDVGHDAVRSARQAVRDRIVKVRRWSECRPDPAAIEAARKHFEREREASAQRFAGMRRVVIHAFPPKQTEAVVLVDAGQREISTFIGEEIAEARLRRLRHSHLIAFGTPSIITFARWKRTDLYCLSPSHWRNRMPRPSRWMEDSLATSKRSSIVIENL